jgi:hypothetical protein
VNLINPEFPKVFTNYENMVGEHSTYYYKVKNDCEVIAKISRFSDKPNHLYTMFLYDKKNDYYDVIDKEIVEDLTEKFGFAYNNDKMDNLEEGAKIKKNEILYKSLSYDEDMNYCYGLNATVIYLMDTRTIEDAAVCSESFAKRMVSKEIESVEISLNDNDVFCNIYGNKNEYKCFPDIGETTTSGIGCAVRRIHNNQMLHDLKITNLKNINPNGDIPYYFSGKVLDIFVYSNKNIDEIEENVFNKQLLYYLREQQRYYQEMNKVCKEIIESGSKYSDTIGYMYRRSNEILNPNYKWRLDDGAAFSNMKIEFLIENDMPLMVGGKITGTSGDKSVISQIVPDDEMPYVKVNGKIKRAEVILNPLGVPNRLNTWQLFQLSINFVCNRVVERLETMKDIKEKEVLLFDIVKRFNDEQHERLMDYYNKLNKSKKEEFFKDVEENGIFIHIPPLWEDEICLFDKLRLIYQDYPGIELYEGYINMVERYHYLIK